MTPPPAHRQPTAAALPHLRLIHHPILLSQRTSTTQALLPHQQITTAPPAPTPHLIHSTAVPIMPRLQVQATDRQDSKATGLRKDTVLRVDISNSLRRWHIRHSREATDLEEDMVRKGAMWIIEGEEQE